MKESTPECSISGQQQLYLQGNESSGNSSASFENTTVIPVLPPANCCKEPWSNVPENVFPNLWRVVYWTSQCLTW